MPHFFLCLFWRSLVIFFPVQVNEISCLNINYFQFLTTALYCTVYIGCLQWMWMVFSAWWTAHMCIICSTNERDTSRALKQPNRQLTKKILHFSRLLFLLFALIKRVLRTNSVKCTKNREKAWQTCNERGTLFYEIIIFWYLFRAVANNFRCVLWWWWLRYS